MKTSRDRCVKYVTVGGCILAFLVSVFTDIRLTIEVETVFGNGNVLLGCNHSGGCTSRIEEKSNQTNTSDTAEYKALSASSADNSTVIHYDKLDHSSIHNIITRGDPRTATTLHFNIVCASFFLHLKVYRPKLAKKLTCSFTPKKQNIALEKEATPQVIKTHKEKISMNDAKNSTFFFTAKSKADAKRDMKIYKSKGFMVGYIQDLETLSEIKVKGVVDAHANVFDLSSQYSEMLQEYFDLWEKLRMCCGLQMSKYWRNELYPVNKKNTTMKAHPLCGSLDIDTVEQQFMNTTLYKLLDQHKFLKTMNKPSLIDGSLDGTYCSRYNCFVKQKGAKFNQSRKTIKKQLKKYDSNSTTCATNDNTA